MKIPSLVILATSLAANFSFAEMVFEKKLVEIEVSPDQKVVIGEFPFTIKDEAETILSYEAGCTCLEARVEPLMPDRSMKKDWKVGETGKIMARFDTSRFLGTVEKPINLKLAGGEKPIQLMVRIKVPEIIKLEPNTLRWDVGAEAEEKTIKITMNYTDPIKITSHSGNNKNYSYELKTVTEGREYELKVKPGSTKSAGMGMISLRTDSKFSRFKRAIAYNVVRPKRKSKPTEASSATK